MALLATMLLVAGPLPARAQDRELTNLRAVAKAVGYIQYFCPEPGALAADWHTVTREAILAAEHADDPASLARSIQDVLRRAAPCVSVVSGERPAPPALPESGAFAVCRLHHSLGRTDAGARTYFSKLIHLPRSEYFAHQPALPLPGVPLVRDLGGDAWCVSFPAMYSDDSAAPAPPPARPANAGPLDRAGRIAVAITAWNIFQHFYPYHEECGTNMDAALTLALEGARGCQSDRELLDVLRRLVAHLNDGHGLVHHASDPRTHTLPILWDLLDGRLVITASEIPELSPGDIVLSIDGEPAMQRWSQREPLVAAATPGSKRFKTGQALLIGGPGEVTLEIADANGAARSLTIAREPRADSIREVEAMIPPKATSRDLGDGIWYINVDQITPTEYVGLISSLRDASGIVFDLRGYPRRIGFGFLGHFIDAPIPTPTTSVPIATLPDREGLAWETASWSISPNRPPMTRNVAFIVDGRVVSSAEHLLGAAEGAGIGTIIGEPTAGTNGNINPVELPGGFRIVWTGMRVTKPDGSQHHAVGIHPDIHVSPTMEGLRAGRDEMLERAIAHLRANR